MSLPCPSSTIDPALHPIDDTDRCHLYHPIMHLGHLRSKVVSTFSWYVLSPTLASAVPPVYRLRRSRSPASALSEAWVPNGGLLARAPLATARVRERRRVRSAAQGESQHIPTDASYMILPLRWSVVASAVVILPQPPLGTNEGVHGVACVRSPRTCPRVFRQPFRSHQ